LGKSRKRNTGVGLYSPLPTRVQTETVAKTCSSILDLRVEEHCFFARLVQFETFVIIDVVKKIGWVNMGSICDRQIIDRYRGRVTILAVPPTNAIALSEIKALEMLGVVSTGRFHGFTSGTPTGLIVETHGFVKCLLFHGPNERGIAAFASELSIA